MNWYRWGKPKDDRPIPIAPPRELEEQWRINIVTDTETYPVDPVPKSKLTMFAQSFAQYGASLEREGKPVLFIPARRIMEMNFEKLET